VFKNNKNLSLWLIAIFIVSGLIISWRLFLKNPPAAVNNLNKSQTANDLEGGPAAFQPVSLPALFEKDFNGSNLTLGRVILETDKHIRYYITYQSGELTISGIINVPKGEGPFPVLILNHGHIDTSVYTNGRGLRREQDFLADNGYVVIHPDYRNHADSGKDDRDKLAVRLGYVEDVINAVYAVKNSALPFLDKENIGMFGHSMGGGITLSVLVAQPDLVDAAVLYAPVSGDMRKSFERWLENDSASTAEITQLYGLPNEVPDFWDNLSAETFYQRIQAPVMIFHGTADESVPLAWSQETLELLKTVGVEANLIIYDGEVHEFVNRFADFMQSTKEFFDRQLKSV